MDINGIIRRQRLSRLFILWIGLLLVVIPSGCGNESPNPSPGTISTGGSETSSASLTIRWIDTPPADDATLLRTAALDCQATGVENVVVKVYDASGTHLVTGGPWPCTASGGRIDRIPIGQDRRFVALAEDAEGNARYQGETAGITIQAGEITQGVVIDASLFIPTLTAPTNEEEVDPNTVSLEWEVVDSADEYIVQVAEDIDFQTIAIDETTPGTAYAPSNLLPSRTYFWKISAVDPYGNIGVGSEIRTFSTTLMPVISGVVSTASGAPISGVTVTFSDGGGTATTDAEGAYARPVAIGWSGTATPSTARYDFSPTSRSYTNVTVDQSNQNYTGTAVTPTISGLVRTANGTGVSGVTVTFSNNGGSATTNNAGAYSAAVPFGWSGTATPSRSGYNISPTSRSYNNVTADQANQNYTGTAITPTVSGVVRDAEGTALSAVTITFSNNGGSATTNGAGAYNATVPFGWSGTATPSRSGLSFNPASRNYNNVTTDQANQNYTGTAITPTISGLVRTADGTAVSGVTVTFSNNGGSATTNASGAYSAAVPFGWSGTATPARSGYNFSPASRSYNNVTTDQANQNYTATAITPTISGLVRNADGTGISGVTVTLSNNGGSTTTNTSGAYSTTVPFGWSGTATPSRSGYSFSPATRDYSNVTTNQANQNYTGTIIQPTISGIVQTSAGNGISGVTVTLSNNGGSATTGTSGAYSITVPFGWSGTSRPSRSGYTFSPATRDYSNVTTNQANQNFTGTPITPIISGFVQTATGLGIGEVTITFDNNGGTTTTNSSGAYSRAVPFGWSGTVTPTRSGYRFSPTSRDYSTVTATQTNQNYTGTALPVVTVTATDASAAEASEFPGPGTYRISRSGSTALPLTIFFSMSGSASNGIDYQTLTSPITLDNTQSFRDITLMPLNDQIDEANETAQMTIAPDNAYAIGTPSSATVTIIDDDESLLINCPNNGGGDLYWRGFYATSYPGINISSVTLYLSSITAGTYNVSLTVREGSYSGRLVGTSSTSVTLTSDVADHRQAFFSFPQKPSVTQNSVLTFALDITGGPGTSVYYAWQTSSSCPVVQTTDTQPPLSTFRRNGVAMTIFGDRL